MRTARFKPIKPIPNLHNPGKKIGIITGSGPEAGVDLWQKILLANRKILGQRFRGDLDAPNLTIISEPSLGMSMDLEENHEAVWHCLEHAAREIARRVDYYAIACNTLNFYQPQLEALNLPAKLISFADVALDYLQKNHVRRIALLGAKPVTDLGPWSHYRKLAGQVEIELPKPQQAAQLHQLIHDVKTFGAGSPEIRARFRAILDALESRTVLLACTELPLIQIDAAPAALGDVTQLVAHELAQLCQAEAP